MDTNQTPPPQPDADFDPVSPLDAQKKTQVPIQEETAETSPIFSAYHKTLFSTRHKIETIAKQYHIDAFIAATAATRTPAERCLDRRNYLALRQQNNLEKIIKYAHISSRDNIATEPDPDWLARFIEMAQNIHGEAMQKMWGEILRKELSSPNYISLKSLAILESMSHKEVQLFQNAGALTCHYGHDPSRKIIIGYERTNSLFLGLSQPAPNNLSLGDYQLPYSSLLVLMDLGLLFRSELLSGAIDKDNQLVLFYPDADYHLKARGRQIKLVYYRLTQMGNELYTLLGAPKRQTYIDAITELLAQTFEVRC